MGVKVYGIAASGYKKPSVSDGKDVNVGNGLNFGNGLILTSSHLFNENYADGSVFTADSQYFGVNQEQASGPLGISVGAPENLYAYNPASPSGNDLAIVNAGVSIDSASLTPVVVFADQVAAANFLTKHSAVTLSTVTAQNGNTGTFQGIIGNSNANTGDDIKTTIAAQDGDSGGIATVVAGSNNTTYAVGILSSSDQSGQNARFTTINDIAYNEASAGLGKGIDPSTMPTDLILGATSNENIRGSVRKADIITNGDNDVILAGSGGGLINTGIGQNDVVFLPGANGQSDAGTTVVVGPGTTTLVGGGANDKLVLLADRLPTVSGIATTLTDSSNTIQLLGGFGTSSYSNNQSALYTFGTTAYMVQNGEGQTNVVPNGNNGNYIYNINYVQKGTDLLIVTGGQDGSSGVSGWNGSVTIKNFQNGEYGINLQISPIAGEAYNSPITQSEEDTLSAAVLSETAAPQSAISIDDDPAVKWDGILPYSSLTLGTYGYQGPTLTDAQISADLAAVIANTQGNVTTPAAPPPPPPTGNQTFAANDVTGSISAGYVATVTGNRDTITATETGSTINFSGTGETAAISGGSVSLTDSATATVTGNTDSVTMNGHGTVSLSGTGNTLYVNGAGNTATMSSGTISVSDQAGATLTGSGDTIGLGTGDTLSLSGSNTVLTATGTGDAITVTGSGTGNSVNLQGTGSSATLSGGSVQLAASIAATLSGSNDYVYVDTSGTLTLTGNTNTVNAHGAGDVISATGTGNTVDVGSTGDQVTMGSGTLSFSDHAGATLTGSGDTIGLGTGDTLSLSGSNTVLTATGTGDSVTVTGSGTGNSVNLQGTGSSVTLSGGSVQLAASIAATLSGSNNYVYVDTSGTLTLTGNTNTVNAHGTGDVITATGTGNTVYVGSTGAKLTMGSGTVSVSDHAGGTLTGSGDTIGLGTGDTLSLSGSNTILTATGTGDSVTVTGTGTGNSINLQGSSSSVTLSGGSVQLAAGIAATLSGSNDYVYVDTSGTLTLTGNNNTINAHGAGDSVTATGTGNVLGIGATGATATISSGAVSLLAGSGATVTGNGDTFSFLGASTLSVSGNTESFVYTASPQSASLAGFNATDQMTFDHTTFANWQSLLGHASQIGADTVIHTDTSHSVTLQHVTVSSLQQSQFHFA